VATSGNPGKNPTGRRRADDALALALAAGATLEQAAEQSKVSLRTACRRLEDPAFTARVAEFRTAMVDRAVGFLAAGMSTAASTLWHLVSSRNERVALTAARAVLELAVKIRESTEMEQRLVRLEGLLGEKKPKP
jgi:hypothetical protein